MFLEILLFMAGGIALGILTGLLPGLHPNTVFVLVLSLAVFFAGFPVIYTLVFIISLSVSNVFLDFIPSILFGAPDPDSCLSVLPGHQMLMEGRGYEAVFLSTVGGLGAIMLTILTLPLLLFAIPGIYSQIHPFIHILLIAVVGWMVWTEQGSKKIWALLVFALAGIFGMITLNTLPSNLSMFPALTGLFGLSGLIVSFYGKSKLPEQKKAVRIESRLAKGTVLGWFAGMIAGLLPGIGSSQAGIVAGQAFRAKTKDFLTALGGINAANIIFTLVAFYTLGKTRSGAVSAMAQLTPSISVNELMLLMVVAMLTTLISVILTLKIAGLVITRMHSVSYRKINLSIIVFLIAAVVLFTGLIGILISFAGTLLGIAAIKLGVKRSHMMGFLILPTILYFSGLTAGVSHFMGI
ncbi:MAG: tripartite tricarboxylate transporter permease [Candidatus Aenigmarchaeota archaeon]|nr:tripartite tricarboxylate transporter permease [Candidatus Aenigmarchaeota archaeon]